MTALCEVIDVKQRCDLQSKWNAASKALEKSWLTCLEGCQSGLFASYLVLCSSHSLLNQSSDHLNRTTIAINHKLMFPSYTHTWYYSVLAPFPFLAKNHCFMCLDPTNLHRKEYFPPNDTSISTSMPLDFRICSWSSWYWNSALIPTICMHQVPNTPWFLHKPQ